MLVGKHELDAYYVQASVPEWGAGLDGEWEDAGMVLTWRAASHGAD